MCLPQFVALRESVKEKVSESWTESNMSESLFGETRAGWRAERERIFQQKNIVFSYNEIVLLEIVVNF